jgi:hypothetical protein
MNTKQKILTIDYVLHNNDINQALILFELISEPLYCAIIWNN